MADLVKALEADLFGAYEWAADHYDTLAAVPEPVERHLALQGLFRALEAIERPEDAQRALEAMVEAEDAIPSDVRARLAPLAAARERLLDAHDPKEQAETFGPAYVAAFEPLWDAGPREPLVADAILVALTRANLIAPRHAHAPGVPAPEAASAHRDAGQLYAAAAGLFEARVRAGELVWQETARSAWHRAMVAWRSSGDEDRALAADEAARGLGAGAGSYR